MLISLVRSPDRLGGLLWKDVDLTRGEVLIQRQIVMLHSPDIGPPKGKVSRKIRISAETVTLLRRHKAHQAELKLQSGGTYHDHGLVFAKEWFDVQRKHDTLGDPLGLNTIGASVSSPA